VRNGESLKSSPSKFDSLLLFSLLSPVILNGLESSTSQPRPASRDRNSPHLDTVSRAVSRARGQPQATH
jgi:hypothetical protein